MTTPQHDTPTMLTVEQFFREHRPIRNHLTRKAAFEGYLFEAFGAEYRYICGTKTHQVWTLIETAGHRHVMRGWHFFNRLGYFLTDNQNGGVP